MDKDVRLLIGKLNADCRNALEQAAALCKSQTQYSVEIEHLLLRLIALPAPDVDLVLRRFEVKPEAVSAQLTAAMDRFETGNPGTTALSPQLAALMREAWQISSQHLGEQFVRSGSLVLALLQVDSLRSRLLESAPALLQIPLEALRRELPQILAESIERDVHLLIGKLNADCRDALEQAGALCNRLMHDNVEIEHLLLRLIALPAPDVDLVLRRFEVKPEAVSAQLTAAMDRFKTGNWGTTALSPHLAALMQEAWQISSQHLGEQFVRSGSLVLALLQVDSLRSRLLESAPALLQIPLEALRRELPEILAESIEGTMIGREPYRFDFFQAVRLLELLRPRAISPGHGGSNREPVAFRSKVGLDFPASDIVSAEFPKRDPSAPVRLTVAFMGLAGDSGPLPTPFTELVIQRTAAGDYATRDFLDIFNHRLISFLYRSRKKHRIALDNRPPEQTECAQWLFGLAGLEFAAAKEESRKWARSLLRYSGILSHQVRSMAALEAMLTDFFKFKVPVRGEQLLGRWLVIEPRDRTRIGRRKGANQRLGVDTVLGKRAWDQMGRIRLRISVPDLIRVREFLPALKHLPAGRAFQSLSRIARVHLQQDIDIELHISLEPGQISGMRLGSKIYGRLGWTSWLNTGRSRAGDDPVRLRLPALYQDGAYQKKAA